MANNLKTCRECEEMRQALLRIREHTKCEFARKTAELALTGGMQG